ncbi:GspH/FimT family pseudopilin [Marinobacter litoralis]|uniref:GspH/FimT family pseudopilin n=1 Tax=Marinobacter litoralis TaxID=187981 RepID=UPI0018EC8EE2|nr:GspH/FimT family pseudopilin [Marinobacter litoralis]MBJ6138651.1 GspH/FimT family pseudopilin [Marinobacter litoralis]
MHNRTNKTCGFTLVELLVAIVIISVIANYTVPSLGSLLNSARRQSAVSDMIALINFARNTAIMEQRTITMCPLDQTNRCSNNWNNTPITVFRDSDADRVLSSTNDVVRIKELTKGGTWKASTANRSYFRFFATGQASYAIGNMVWCPDNKNSGMAAQVIINMGGRPRLSGDQDGDGILEDANGNPVVCR